MRIILTDEQYDFTLRRKLLSILFVKSSQITTRITDSETTVSFVHHKM